MNKFLLCLTFFLPALRVVSQAVPDTMPDAKIATVVVTAQFTPTDARQSVNSVRVLNRQTIERRSVTSLEELLQTEPNLRIAQDPILGSSLSINGLRGENLKILVDGVPVVGRLNGSLDAGQLPVNAVQQVEIIEGAQSLLYGSEASAGVINLVTRKSQLHRFEAEATGQMETSGLQLFQGRVGARWGKFHLQVNGSKMDFNPPQDTAYNRDQLWNPKHQQSGRAMLRYSPSKKLDIRLSGGLFEEVVDNLGDLRRPQYKPYAFDDYYQTNRKEASLHAEGWTANRLFWQATAGWNRFDRIKNTYRYDFETTDKTLVEGEQDTSGASGLLTRFTLSSDFKNRPVNFLVGLENYAETAEGIRIVDSTANKPGQASGNDLGIFASLRFKLLEQITLQGGARYTQNKLYGSALTPTVWLFWQPQNTNWQLRMSYASGFRSPGLKELYFNFIDVNHYLVGNTDLKPEYSHNLKGEINWKLATPRDYSLGVKASGFFNRVRNRIVLSEFAPVQYRYINLERWQTAGGGIGVTFGYSNWLQFRSEVVVTGFYNEFAGDSLQTYNWSPDWVNDLTLTFVKDKFHVNFWHKMTGRTPYYFEDDNTVLRGQSDAWHLLNASAGTSLFKKRIRLNAGVKNLLGTRQIRSGATELGHASGDRSVPVHWGRTYFVSLSVLAFGK